MKGYLQNRWIQVGLTLVVVGWGPLLAIVLLATIGLWPDPNPNPVGPGLLFFVTSWPAIGCLVIGFVQVRRKRAADGISHAPLLEPATRTQMLSHPGVRAVAGLAGIWLVIKGASGLRSGQGREAAATLVLGVVGLYWCFAGRIPTWFRR